MSKFLNELESDIDTCSLGGIMLAKRRIAKLGENARRMLEIGIVQDELVKLGFKPNLSNPAKWDNFITFASNTATVKRVNIFFGIDVINVSNRTYDYYSPTFHEDVINKVKELIND